MRGELGDLFMNPFTIAFVVSFALIGIILTICKLRVFWFLGGSLILSQSICVYDILFRDPAQIIWLCNVAVFLNIFLLFRFHQKVFDIYYCFAWIGCLFICLMPTNPYSVMLKELPIVWVAYWIKHLAPLMMSIYFLYVEKRKLSCWLTYTGAFSFLVYCFVTYFYNLAFGQNILYLNKPAPFMVNLGNYYFLIAVMLGYFWLGILEMTGILMGVVKYPKRKSKTSKQVAKSYL